MKQRYLSIDHAFLAVEREQLTRRRPGYLIRRRRV